MLCSFISDSIFSEIECVECLCEKIDLSFMSMKRKLDSLCCFEVQQTNVLLVFLRFDSVRDRVCLVSV